MATLAVVLACTSRKRQMGSPNVDYRVAMTCACMLLDPAVQTSLGESKILIGLSFLPRGRRDSGVARGETRGRGAVFGADTPPSSI